MNFYSSRDISGPFVLNCDKRNINKKDYIKLELRESIIFADPITQADYQNQRRNFISRYKNRDQHISFWEKRYIPGVAQYNLVSIGQE